MKPLTERLQDIVGFVQFETGRIGAASCIASEAIDRIDFLESELENAVEVAFKHGATEWTRLNYPDQYKRLSGE